MASTPSGLRKASAAVTSHRAQSPGGGGGRIQDPSVDYPAIVRQSDAQHQDNAWPTNCWTGTRTRSHVDIKRQGPQISCRDWSRLPVSCHSSPSP